MSTQHTPMFRTAVMLAIKHHIALGRDSHGNYYVRRGGQIVDTTRSAVPSVANVKALILRNAVRQ